MSELSVKWYLLLNRVGFVDRQQPVVDLKRQDRQRRVGQSASWGDVPVASHLFRCPTGVHQIPAADLASFSTKGGMPGISQARFGGLHHHKVVAIAAIPMRPGRMVCLEEKLGKIEIAIKLQRWMGLRFQQLIDASKQPRIISLPAGVESAEQADC